MNQAGTMRWKALHVERDSSCDFVVLLMWHGCLALKTTDRLGFVLGRSAGLLCVAACAWARSLYVTMQTSGSLSLCRELCRARS